MKNFKTCLSATALLTALSCLAPTVSAFDYNSAAWCCREIVYCVNPTEPDSICLTSFGTNDRSFVDVVNAAALSWNAQGTAFQLAFGDTTSNTACAIDVSGICAGKLDGQNVVSVSTACPLPAGVIATAWWWWSGSPEACCIFEADICISNDVSWYEDSDPTACVPGNTCYDLESVMLHEFGHWVSLGHENDDGILGYRPSMFSSFGFCEMRRSVTADDSAGLAYVYNATDVIIESLRCDPLHSHPAYATSPKTLITTGCPNNCSPCPPGGIYCDSITTDPCLVICPASDIVWTATVKDSCGNPVCDLTGIWLDFSGCDAKPCPGEEPNWPLVFPDSCDPATGTHYFTIDAGHNLSPVACPDCQIPLMIGGAICRMIPARFLDLDGDLCVTPADWLGQAPCNDYDCNGIIDTVDQNFFDSHIDHCCPSCPPGAPFCDSTVTDPCLVICPASDIVWTATIKDSCGNPICDMTGTYLDFSNCPAVPCPGEEPNWPLVFPDSCDPATGVHYFTVDASWPDPALGCDCVVDLFVNGAFCRGVQARFLDLDGDFCVTPSDWFGVAPCNDYDCNGIIDTVDQNFFDSHIDHCCPSCPPGAPFCDSTVTDPCLVICPASDIVWTATIMDSCGNPICDPTSVWLDLSNCDAVPCPGEEPNWPLVFPDSCDPATGVHYFTVDASWADDPANSCDCMADLFVNGAFCRSVPTKFLDLDGDFCVTQADWFGVAPCNDYDCNGIIDTFDQNFFNSHLTHCCPTCPPGPPFCDSITIDPCLVICPASDIVWTATVKDSCGNPICDITNIWLDFSQCDAAPCPGEEPNWPLVFPDSCDPVTGKHYFTVDASWISPATGCDCDVPLIVGGAICKIVHAKFLDINGDFCVTPADWLGTDCNDYDCNGIIDAFDQNFFNSHLDHCCPTDCPPGQPFCDSTRVDPCLVICPLSDIVYQVQVMDSCGNPICDMTGTFLNIPNCEALPCPTEEPFWPQIFPDSCDPATGIHYFTVDASQLACADCFVDIYVNGVLCRTVPAKFLDTNGDFCVTPNDFVNQGCNDYNCNGADDIGDIAIFNAHLDHCCPPPCPPGPPICDSIVTDPCLVICPASDIVWTATLKDSCGNPICDLSLALDFSGCNALPCPGEEPNWPLVFPDSCNPITGIHYFTVDASHNLGADPCPDCQVALVLGGMICRMIPTKFLDLNGDFCVFPDDWLAQAPCNDYDCDGSITAFDQTFWNSHLDHCCPLPCDAPAPFCDSVTTDPCLLICPASDIVWTAVIKDSCGNPVCDMTGTWLDFTNCTAAIDCPGEEPNWPRVYPDSCDAATGRHYFTVDAGLNGCVDCPVDLFVNSVFCRNIPAQFLDVTGDLCVDKNDWQANPNCNDYNCNGIIDANDSLIHANHVGHCCGPQSGKLEGSKFHDKNCNGLWDAGEPPLSGWTINLIQGSTIIASTTTNLAGNYSFNNLCSGDFKVTEIVQAGWVQTFPPTVLYTIDLLCNEVRTDLDFGNVEDTCSGLSMSTFQLDGTADNFVGSEPSSPGLDLLPLLNCPLGSNNFFDSVMVNKCFGHTFSGFWDTTCCITDAQLCMRLKATGSFPNTDGIAFAEDGQYIWALSMNALQSLATGGSDTLWSSGDIMQICLDLANLPAWPATGITNVLAALKDGDFDIRFQDDTEVDWLELRVTICCSSCCNHDGIRGDFNYDFSLDIADLTYLVAYFFGGGPAPPCLIEADVNGDGSVDISDLTYFVAYLFLGGPPPVPC